MKEVLEMLRTGNKVLVEKRIAKDARPNRSSSTEFYGWLYLGLYEDALGDRVKAKAWLDKSVTIAPRNYMGDVARVYVKYLEAKTPRR